MSALTSDRACGDDDPIQSRKMTVSEAFSSLMKSFGTVLLKLDADSQISDSPILEAAYEEFTRLKVWGLQNRVAAPSSDPGSIGVLLEEQPEIGQLVFEVLQDATASLSKILQGLEDGTIVPCDDIDELECDSDTSSSSEESSAPSLVAYLKQVFDNVGELYKLQSLLRKPRMKGKYLHSTQALPELAGYQQDYQHVRQKLLDWRNDPDTSPHEQRRSNEETTSSFFPKSDEFPGISPDILLQRQKSEESSEEPFEKLCRRLATANSKRRKQLRYWQSHPYQEPTHYTAGHVAQKSLTRTVRDMHMQITKATMPDNGAPVSDETPTTVHSFSTAPRSAIMIAERHQPIEDMARTTYQLSVVGSTTRSTIRVPDVPQITGDGEATICPYCQAPLSGEILNSRDSWKRHVFRDLRPYVCTVGGCADPDKQYAARYDWKYHEMQVHHRQWDCTVCRETFENRDMFRTHLSSSHSMNLQERRVSTLLDMGERAKDDASLSVCPLCFLAVQQIRLLDHVAGHIEEISLFALPRGTTSSDGDEEGISNKVHGESSNRSLKSHSMSWYSTDEPSYMTEKSIHMDCFHHARRAEKVANQLDIWKTILRNVSNPGPDEWIDYIHRSVQYLRTIGDFIMFRNIGDIALQYLNIILLSHSSILSRILSYLKDPSPGMEEGWAEIMSYGAIDVHCQALIELHRCMTSDEIRESMELGRLRRCLKAVLSEQGLELIPPTWSNKDFEEFHRLPGDHYEPNVAPHWPQSLFSVHQQILQHRQHLQGPRIFERPANPLFALRNIISDAKVPNSLFDNGKLSVYLFYHKGEFVSLRIHRSGAHTIRVIQEQRAGQPPYRDFATLCFDSYEELAVYWCLFFALKYDSALITSNGSQQYSSVDIGNLVVFEADIRECGQTLRLEVCRDTETNSMRLHANSKNNRPVWTTFHGIGIYYFSDREETAYPDDVQPRLLEFDFVTPEDVEGFGELLDSEKLPFYYTLEVSSDGLRL
ncbi:uncharacterized protein PG998_002813 [Apiospora kogelbergensis]|uniref:uncharacterized protein n=1 Tax=Apiospora kogelbergensis TaxID=1337665 RepID=UPI00312EEBD7